MIDIRDFKQHVVIILTFNTLYIRKMEEEKKMINLIIHVKFFLKLYFLEIYMKNKYLYLFAEEFSPTQIGYGPLTNRLSVSQSKDIFVLEK